MIGPAVEYSHQPGCSERPGSADSRPGGAPAPVGLVLAAVIAGIVLGTLAGTRLAAASPLLAWPACVALCGLLFLLTRLVSQRNVSAIRVFSVAALAFTTFSCLSSFWSELALGWRPLGRGAFWLFAGLGGFVGIFVASAAITAGILAAGFRGKAGSFSLPRGARTLLVVKAGFGAVAVVLTWVLLVLILGLAPRAWVVPLLLGLAVAGPVLSLPLLARAYRRLLTRWEVPRVPASLTDQLEVLGDRTGFAFSRVVCLDDGFGAGRACEVVLVPGSSTLVISAQLAERLAPEQLLALLAHESAHVVLCHARRKLAWGALIGALGAAFVIGTQVLVGSLVPVHPLVQALFVVLPLSVLQKLYDHYIIRTYETEADALAVDVAGAPALIGALEALHANAISAAHVHNRWTTHGTWEARSAKIKALDSGA